MTPDSTLCVFVGEFPKFAVTAFNGSFLIICGDFNSCDASFFSSPGHQNLLNIPFCSDAHLESLFITDVGIYVTLKRSPLPSSDHHIIRVLF